MTRKGGRRPPPRVHEGEPIVAEPTEARDEAGEERAGHEASEEPTVAPDEASDAEAPEPTEGPGDEVALADAPGTGDVAPEAIDAEPETGPEVAGEVAEAARDRSTEETVAADMPDETAAEPAAAEPAAAEPLDELAAAPRAVPGVVLSDELPIDPDDDLRGVEGEASLRLVSILESLLFSAAKPMSVKDLRKVLAETSQHQIKLGLRHLMEATRSRGVVLAQVAGGFQFRTHPDNAIWVQKMLQAKPARLSRTQIETLAIIAYRQPITRPEIDDIRGVDSGAVLKSLLEREMIQIVGKKEEPGRPLLYGTTVRFLEFFNLRSLRDLPTLRDFRDLSEESKATLREKLGDLQIAEALGQEVLGLPEGQGETNLAEGAGEASAAAGDEAPVEAPADAEAPAEPAAGEEPAEPAAGEESSGAVGHGDGTELATEPGPEPEAPAAEPAEEIDGAAGLVGHDELPRDALPIDGVDPVVLPEDMTAEPSQVVSGGAAAQDDEVVEVVLPVESPPIAGDPSPADALATEIVVSTGELVEAVAPAPEEFVAELAALVHASEVAREPDSAAESRDEAVERDVADMPDESATPVERDVADVPDESTASAQRDVADEADETAPDEATGAAEDAGERPDAAADRVEPAPVEPAGEASPPLAREGEEPQDAAPGEAPADERDSTE